MKCRDDVNSQRKLWEFNERDRKKDKSEGNKVRCVKWSSWENYWEIFMGFNFIFMQMTVMHS